MVRRKSAIVLSLLMIGIPAARGAESDGDVGAVLRLMPAEWPASAVFANLKKFDENINVVAKQVTGNAPEDGLLDDIRDDLGFAEWVDFSKPFGMAVDQLGGGSNPVIWARVPDAQAKLKSKEGAKEVDGVWEVSGNGSETAWVKLAGDYVVAATSKEHLAKATSKENRSLADEMKSRADMLAGRDMYFHLNIDPVRSAALGGLAQMAQMAPMLAMMAGQQAGLSDPAMLTGGFTVLVDVSKKLVEQIAYVDISVGLEPQSGRATIATGYRDGPIKTYLSRQKPASQAMFTEIEDQPWTIAVGYHVPGAESPFFAYVCDQMKNALTSTPAAGAGADAETAKKAVGDSIQLLHDMYSAIEGMNYVLSFSPQGVKGAADMTSSDPSKIMELVRKSMTAANSMMKPLSPGIGYENAGTIKVGDVTVEKFKMKMDDNDPKMAAAEKILGDTQIGMGVQRGRVRAVMGNEKELERGFSGSVSKPLSASPAVRETLAKLPSKQNAALLLNLGAIPMMLGSILGEPPAAIPQTSGGPPPVGISVSLSGDPARVDLYVPIKTVEEMVKSFQSPKAGMKPGQ